MTLRASRLVATVVVVVILAIGATRCDRDVLLGADPGSDAAPSDAGDAGQGD